MTTNFREILGITKLVDACGVAKEERSLRQKKAIKNIKYCADDQWQFVNGWYDERNENDREYMMDANQLFNTIYKEAQTNIYDEGVVYFGGTESYLKDIRFCGKNFLERVCLFYTAKLMEEAIYEVEGTDKDAERIVKELTEIKNRIIK